MDGTHLLCLCGGFTFGLVIMGLVANIKLARWQAKAQAYVLRMHYGE